MRTMYVLALILIIAIFSGCGSQIEENDQHSKQIKDLQDQLILLKEKTTAAFIIIGSNPIGRSVMGDFFLTSDKIFGDIVDVGYSSCTISCVKITDEDAKNQCLDRCGADHNPFPEL